MASSEGDDLFLNLCSVLFTLLRPSSDHPPPLPRRTPPPLTPAGFASLLLGASLALMVCGSVTFVIGFILMPWVLGIVILFYFLDVLSDLTGFWISLFCPTRKEVSGCVKSEDLSWDEKSDFWIYIQSILLNDERSHSSVHCVLFHTTKKLLSSCWNRLVLTLAGFISFRTDHDIKH